MNLLMVRVSQGLHCENKKAPFENKDRINRDSSGAARAISTRFREKKRRCIEKRGDDAGQCQKALI